MTHIASPGVPLNVPHSLIIVNVNIAVFSFLSLCGVFVINEDFQNASCLVDTRTDDVRC